MEKDTNEQTITKHNEDSQNLPTPAIVAKMIEAKMRMVSILCRQAKSDLKRYRFSATLPSAMHHTPISSLGLHVGIPTCITIVSCL